MPDPTLLMIRPQMQSEAFVSAFTAATGKSPATLISPLMGIEHQPLRTQISRAQALLFTSVNGVNAFAAQAKDRSIPTFCVGHNTAETARSHGFSAVSANGSAADLLALAMERLNRVDQILYVSGRNSAMDLAAKLFSKGYNAKRVVVYQQTARILSKEALFLLGNSPAVVPVFSANSARMLLEQIRGKTLLAPLFVCISESVRKPFAFLQTRTLVASHPTRGGMIETLEPLW